MPVINTDELSNIDLIPSYTQQPNERFATTFLSIQNRDYAVKGESLMDKATGEIFSKRTADGRVVSFFQNKKYVYDLMVKLKISMNNNPLFRYDEDGLDNVYYNIDYDLISTQAEDISKVDIRENNLIDFGDSGLSKIVFPIEPESTGFFIRLTSRDADKAALSAATAANIKEDMAAHPDSSVIDFDHDATITYTVDIFNGETASTVQATATIRINDESLVIFPDEIQLANKTNMVVHINRINFARVRSKLSAGDAFAYADNHLYIYYMNITGFALKSQDIELIGNEQIVALLDAQTVVEYLQRVSKLAINPAMIRSINRPTKSLWSKNNLWAELVSTVSNNGQTVTINDTEVDIDGLEDFLANNVTSTHNRSLRSIQAAGLTDNEYTLIETGDSSYYSREEMDALLAYYNRNMMNIIDNIVSTNSENTANQGMYVQPLSEEGDTNG